MPVVNPVGSAHVHIQGFAEQHSVVEYMSMFKKVCYRATTTCHSDVKVLIDHPVINGVKVTCKESSHWQSLRPFVSPQRMILVRWQAGTAVCVILLVQLWHSGVQACSTVNAQRPAITERLAALLLTTQQATEAVSSVAGPLV